MALLAAVERAAPSCVDTAVDAPSAESVAAGKPHSVLNHFVTHLPRPGLRVSISVRTIALRTAADTVKNSERNRNISAPCR